ncbi:hypothetical protein GKZ89_18080 [Bacillus mangrovi]|uniref:Uncharacterized protein n=1 Tax=Metabacillus mangrovi TaxID=1491830 RepID=A0A7X2V6K5_9BACI|nr:hypothetical protein [Metabacillus mangrovi]MTH55306.1 hypothetical protein [Metabacillus mangrovi]
MTKSSKNQNDNGSAELLSFLSSILPENKGYYSCWNVILKNSEVRRIFPSAGMRQGIMVRSRLVIENLGDRVTIYQAEGVFRNLADQQIFPADRTAICGKSFRVLDKGDAASLTIDAWLLRDSRCVKQLELIIRGTGSHRKITVPLQRLLS